MRARIGWNMQHVYFQYLPDVIRDHTQARIIEGKSKLLIFEANDAPIFAAVIDLDAGEYLHLREVGGHFARYHEHFFHYMREVTRQMGKKYLSLKTQRKAVAYLAKKHGFAPDQFNDMVVSV